jgi:thiol-disulfide isomerase/thioredoxin
MESKMNLIYEFDNALDIESYLELLGDQKALHELHYKKATITKTLNDFEVLKILVITEPWCGDSTAIIPVLQKILENKNAEIRIALRDKNPDLMNSFLTNEKKAIPIVLVIDESGELIMRYGPRPKYVQDIFEEHRKDIEEGRIEKKDVIRKIRTFYAKDRGQVISDTFLSELNQKLASLKDSLIAS